MRSRGPGGRAGVMTVIASSAGSGRSRWTSMSTSRAEAVGLTMSWRSRGAETVSNSSAVIVSSPSSVGNERPGSQWLRTKQLEPWKLDAIEEEPRRSMMGELGSVGEGRLLIVDAQRAKGSGVDADELSRDVDDADRALARGAAQMYDETLER